MTNDDVEPHVPVLDGVDQLSPHNAAVLLLCWLEARGALVVLDDEDLFSIDLDHVTDFGSLTPELIAAAALCLREEIRHLLIARRVSH